MSRATRPLATGSGTFAKTIGIVRVAPLNARMRETFLVNYTDEIKLAYPARVDGKVILKFPRLFILAVR